MGRYPDHIQDGAGVRRWRENEEWALKGLKGDDASLRLLHEGDLWRCYRNSCLVTYTSTLPSPSSSAPNISSYVQSPSTFELKCVRMALLVHHSHFSDQNDWGCLEVIGNFATEFVR